MDFSPFPFAPFNEVKPMIDRQRQQERNCKGRDSEGDSCHIVFVPKFCKYAVRKDGQDESTAEREGPEPGLEIMLVIKQPADQPKK